VTNVHSFGHLGDMLETVLEWKTTDGNWSRWWRQRQWWCYDSRQPMSSTVYTTSCQCKCSLYIIVSAVLAV